MKNLITLVLALTCATLFGQTAPTNPTPIVTPKLETKLDTVPAFLQLSEIPTNLPNTPAQPAFLFVVNGYVVVETTYGKLNKQPIATDVLLLNSNKQPLEPKYIVWNFRKHE